MDDVMAERAAALVYLVCAIAATGCAALLFRSYRRNPVRLLLWTMLCFVGLAFNNILLFVDRVLAADSVDLSIVRGAFALVSGLILLYGLIWDSK